MAMLKVIDAGGFRPFVCRRIADLHQAQFAGSATGIGIKSAFTPDHRLDERGIHIVNGCGGNDHLVLTMIELIGPPPPPAADIDGGKHSGDERVLQLHKPVLGEALRDVEAC